MKQAILFLAILAAGLAVLIVMLGGTDDLLRDYEKPVIEAQEVEDLSKVLDVPGGRGRLELAMPSAWQGPVTEDHVVIDEDGQRRRIPSSLLVMPNPQRFDEGVLSENPELSLFREDGSTSATLRGDLGTLFATGAGSAALANTEALQARSYHVTGNVIGRVFGEQGDTLLELLTESLRVPFPDRNAAEDEMPPVDCPAPVTLRRPDGSLELHAQSAELDATRRTLVLHGPVDVESLSLSLRPESEPVEDPDPEGAVEPEPPLTVTSDGDLVYRWQEHERTLGDAAPLKRLDDSHLTLTRDVRITRGDLWVEAQFVEAFIKRRVKRLGGGFRMKTLKALGHDGGPVHFGLFEGTGTSTELYLEPGEQLLRMEGPVHLEGVLLERPGQEPLRIRQLAARRQARLTGDPEPPPGGGPRHWRLLLQEEASLLAPGLVEARGDVLDLELLERGNAASTDNTSDATPSSLEFQGLTLTHNASLVFHREQEGSGIGRGDLIQVDLEDGGEQVVNITGAASLDITGAPGGPLEAAHVTGPEIVARLPEGPDTALGLTVESLESAWFDLRGAMPLDVTGTREADAAPTRLTVEPAGPCRLVAGASALTFTGRAVYWIRRGEEPARRLTCDELEFEGLDQDRPTVIARGQVEVSDPVQGLVVHAVSLDLGEEWIAHGAPAYAEVALDRGGLAKVWADELRMNPTTRFLRAENREGRARITAPETLTAGMLPATGDETSRPDADVAEEGGTEAPGTVELLARRIILEPASEEPGDDADDGAREAVKGPRLARLLAHGDVELTRDSDGASVSGHDLVAHLIEEAVRLDGDEDRPAVLLRPIAGQPDRRERVTATWMEFRNGGDEGAVAPGAVFVFFVGSGDGGEAAARRIELVADGVTILDGTEVQTDGGVHATIEDGADTFRARSQRLKVMLSAPFPKGGVPLRILAQREVYLEHPMFTCTGSLLVHDLAAEVFELKAGLEPCRVLSSSAAMPFPVRSRFHFLKARLLFGEQGIPLDDIQIEGLYAEPADTAAATVEAVRR